MIARHDLVQVVLKLSQCRSLDQIVGVLRDTTRELTGADGISIVLRDVDKCYYVEENAVGPLWKGKRFPMSACISGWCMIHREQVVITDIYADARIPHDAYRPTFVKSLAMTPIRSADPVGAIGAYWATQYQATPEQLSTLQALGDSASMALENSQLIDELKDASRRKDEFLTMLAHELRNPLGPIRNGLHLLKLSDSQSEPILQASEMMERQVVHMSRIIDDLLDVARITKGKISIKRSRIDLATLLRQCVNDHRAQIDAAGLTLKLELPLSPIWINADSTRLSQAFSNVLDNARKYTAAGGTVSVTLRADPATQQAMIEIADTGIGIAPQQLPHVFETFMQADTSLDRTAGGLGLGLPVANGFIKLHDGTISANSDGLGQGSRFTITLPNVQVVEAKAPAAAAPGQAGGKLRLLIVEDNKDAANSLQKILKVCGYTTSVAYDGAAGVDLARAEQPDVVLCDIGLPKMDGYTVASTLRQSNETSRARLIAVTGYGSEEDRRKSRSAGFDAHLVKPIDLQELLSQIRLAATAVLA